MAKFKKILSSQKNFSASTNYSAMDDSIPTATH